MTQSTAENIQTYLEGNLDNYLKLLRQMVEINSFTLNPSGVNAVGELTAEVFTELGFTAEAVQSKIPEFGKHTVLTRPGQSGRKIGLISHLDTVFPAEEEERNNFSWREEGDRIYGPGTVDIKGGTLAIYMMMDAMKRFAPKAFDDMTWVILLDACEERGGGDFGELCIERLAPDAMAALIFEAGFMNNDDFLIVAARKGMARYKVTVEGKSAHAGNNHPEGANAIVQLAEVAQRVAALTNYDKNITFNPGVISGGVGVNRVPHESELLVEMRAFDKDVYEKGIADMMALDGLSTVQSAEGDFKCQVKVETYSKVDPWSRNPATDQLFDIWQETGQSLGMSIVRQERGGLSDGNHFWHAIPSLDGLGPYGGNMHCSEHSEDGSKEQEFVVPSTLVPKTVLNTMAVLKLISG